MATNDEVVVDDRKYTIRAPIPGEDTSTTIWEWMQASWKEVADDHTPKTREGIAEGIAKHRAKGGKSYYFFDETGQPVGVIWSESAKDDIHWVHIMFARSALSREAKLAIGRAALRRYFTDGVRKLCWGIYADNRSYIAFLVQLGASVEGTFRKQTPRDGQFMDVILMAAFPEDLQ